MKAFGQLVKHRLKFCHFQWVIECRDPVEKHQAQLSLAKPTFNLIYADIQQQLINTRYHTKQVLGLALKKKHKREIEREKYVPRIKRRKEMKRAVLKETDINKASHPWQHSLGFWLFSHSPSLSASSSSSSTSINPLNPTTTGHQRKRKAFQQNGPGAAKARQLLGWMGDWEKWLYIVVCLSRSRCLIWFLYIGFYDLWRR